MLEKGKGVVEMENKNFGRSVCAIAIPVALQCMLQSSFSIIDQIMIGKLGEVSIAAVGLAGKFSSIFSVVVAAVGAVYWSSKRTCTGSRNYYRKRTWKT